MKLLNPQRYLMYGTGRSEDPFWSGICIGVRDHVYPKVVTKIFRSTEKIISPTLPRQLVARLEDWDLI